MLPVEVRIVLTYEVVANLNLLNSYTVSFFPLIASATATFLFRQIFMNIPDEMVEAARMDGCSPMRFFFDILVPISKTNIAALFVILFIFGWIFLDWVRSKLQHKIGTAIIKKTCKYKHTSHLGLSCRPGFR